MCDICPGLADAVLLNVVVGLALVTVVVVVAVILWRRFRS